MTRPTYGSLFSGVGGMDMGFDTYMDCVFQVEWDKHAQSILRRHWPDVPKWGDVQEVNGADLPPCDVLTFGSPCQDLSVAGKRAGLDGGRSSMFYEAIRIIKEMRNATSSRPTGPLPRIAVWENVPGALSSNKGADFKSVINEMVDIGACLVEWAVLDAQHFGVPQRRRRVFLVAIFDPATAERCPDPLLPVSEGRRGDFAKGRKKGQDVAGSVATSVDAGGVWAAGSDDDILRTSVCSKWAKGSGGPSGSEHYNMVVSSSTHRQLGHGHYVEDDTASALKQRDYKDATDLIATPSVTNDRVSQHGVAQLIGFSHTQGLDPQASQTAWPTLRSEGGGHAVLTEYAVRRLTPLECERLMGWNDDHTRYTDTGKEQADSNRYKQCGNGVAAPVARWIAGHLKEIL